MDQIAWAGRDAFTRELMNDVSPDEIPLIADYQAAIEAKSSGSNVGGLEFGIEDAVIALGPLVVVAGTKLFTDLAQWATTSTEKVIKNYIRKGAQRLLASWLGKPTKGGLRDVLTDEGKKEIVAMVRSSFKGKKIPKEKTDKVIAALERRLFEP